MRMLTLPLSLLLGFCLYLPLPRAWGALCALAEGLYGRFLRLFTRRNGQRDEPLALALFLLLAAGLCQLAGGLHPVAGAVLMAPLFGALSLLTPAARLKDELDSGAYARDTAGYEARVRAACASLGPAFTGDACAPLVLLALGTPLHAGCALGGAYFALRALGSACLPAQRILCRLLRPVQALERGLLRLCSCVVGRNPARAHGADVTALLLSILGIAGDETDTHAPVSGDIAQAIFLCCFAALFLCLVLTLALFPLC